MSQNFPLNPDKLLVVVTSLPNMEAATALAKALIEAHLVACVQMTEGIYSVYRWGESFVRNKRFFCLQKQWPTNGKRFALS